MIYRKMTQVLILFLTSIQLGACQKKDGVSEETYQEMLKLRGKTVASDYEWTLEHFQADDRIPGESYIGGSSIPEAFKEIKVPSQPYVFELKLSPILLFGSVYVKFVDELNINCEGHTEYIKDGKGFELNIEKLVAQIRWRPRKLRMCGSFTIPEGQRLQIFAVSESIFKDFELITMPNSYFSLAALNSEYSGNSPKISLSPNSIMNLR
ncbi:MAG: hypothetical protein ACXVB1_12885, partial [Pseudobdellovibrionaceae bacterium]